MENHGSIWLFRPVSEAAADYLADVIDESAQWWGDALVVEPRFVHPLCETLESDGFDMGLGKLFQ